MKQLHTINSDRMTILQHKIHYLQIFDLNFSGAQIRVLEHENELTYSVNDPNVEVKKHKTTMCA